MDVMEVRHFGSFDLHSNNAVGAIIDQNKKWVLRRKFKNDLATILQALEKYRETLVGIVVESTYNWYVMAAGRWLNGKWLQSAPGSSGRDGYKIKQKVFR